MAEDMTDMAFWWPLVKCVGVPKPRTEVTETDLPLISALDGERIDGLQSFIAELARMAEAVGGYPVFLRTGHISGKHDAANCCFVPSAERLAAHVFALVEFSHMVDVFGLSTRTWAVRQMLPISTSRQAACGLPIVPEARVFIPDGCIHSYWPAEALGQRWCGVTNPEEVAASLAAEVMKYRDLLLSWAGQIGACMPSGTAWSIDFMLADTGWHFIDMAEAHKSWHPEHEPLI